jgi:hypothetical protein
MRLTEGLDVSFSRANNHQRVCNVHSYIRVVSAVAQLSLEACTHYTLAPVA